MADFEEHGYITRKVSTYSFYAESPTGVSLLVAKGPTGWGSLRINQTECVAKLKKASTPDISSKFPPKLIDLLNGFNQWGQFFLVGGCIRDALLGREPKDFDIMVVKPSPEELEKIIPVQKVGAAFPVYLYDTKDPDLGVIELAYARKETKTGIGYNGFAVERVDDVKEDLARRDLTINALAWSPQSGLVTFNEKSLEDVQSQTLRHVTEAFAEDPLRVLRACRFSAQLPGEWKIDPETIEMMRSLKDELPTLPVDRIRLELEKSLKAPKPGNFFVNLEKADCMSYWFPELEPSLATTVALLNRSAKQFPMLEMYCLLAQGIQGPAAIKSFCKRLSLAWGREMELWYFITHCSFSTPEDYITIFRGGRGGKLLLEQVYPLMETVGFGSQVPKLREVESALKALDYKSIKPVDIPATIKATVSSLL